MPNSNRRRGTSWENQVADLVGGIRLGRPHEPDVVNDHLVCECKNLKGLAINSATIEQARGHLNHKHGKGKQWVIFQRQKGKQKFTVTFEGEYGLELLRLAGVAPDAERGDRGDSAG